MSMKVKPGYVNPLTMMERNKNAAKNPIVHEKNEKNKDVTELQTKKQTLQNQVLLLKSSSDGAMMSGELQNNLDQKLEELTAQLKTAKTMAARSMPAESAEEALSLSGERSRYDSYQEEIPGESFGLYEVEPDTEKGYKISFCPCGKEK